MNKTIDSHKCLQTNKLSTCDDGYSTSKTILILTAAFFSAFILLLTSSSYISANETKESKVWEVHPGDNYRALFNQLSPGDQMVFHEGIYSAGIGTLSKSGTPENPIIIKGYGNGEKRPVFLLESSGSNLMQVYANHIVFDYLEFQSKYTYAIRIGAASAGSKFENITIKNCLFYQNGGGDISANASVEYDHIRILNNYFIGSKKTPIYIGEHSGKAKVTNFVFKGNVIDGSQISGDDIIGYGIQLKLNVTGGIIENNFITKTKGPGIMVYGAEDPDPVNANIVRNNIVAGSATDPGIVAGGGPSEITGNITFGCNGGISVQNYGGRNLLNNITLNNNTAVLDLNYGLSFGNMQDIVAQNNHVITSNIASAYRNNPNPGENNSTSVASTELISLVQNELTSVIPANNNLDTIWKFINPGALNDGQVIELIHLILEYKIPPGEKEPLSIPLFNTTENEVRLFPNPAHDFVHIAFDKNILNSAEISFYSVTGKQILSRKLYPANKATFNLKNMDRGIYLIKLNLDNRIYYKKLILK